MAWNFLTPGVRLMHRLRLIPKLSLIGVVLFIPLVFSSVSLVRTVGQQFETTSNELAGVSIGQGLSRTVVEIQKHRGQTNLLLSGDTSARDAAVATRGLLQQAVQATQAAMDASPFPELQPAWREVASRIERLGPSTEAMSASESFATHTELIADVKRLIYDVANASELLFEPEAGPYLAMDFSLLRVVAWTETLAQMRGLGAGELAKAEPSPSAQATLRARATDLRALGVDLRRFQEVARSRGQTLPGMDEALSASESFALGVQSAFEANATSRPAPSDYFAAGTKAIEAVINAQGSALTELQTRLRERLASLRVQMWSAIGLTLGGMALVAYMMAAFFQSFVGGMRFVTRCLDRIAAGDLQLSLKPNGHDELADMLRTLQETSSRVSSMVAEVRSSSALVAFSGSDLVRGNRDLADRTEQQAANLEQTSASMHDLQETVRLNAETAVQADQRATQVRTQAEGSAAAMEAAIASVEAIQQSARRMNEIIGVIDSLAFQTNILALNAAVEAARAGEQGRGFAVVASEVRSLAQRSAESAKEIRGLIQTSAQQVEASVAGIKVAGGNIRTVVDGIRSVASSVNHIAQASNEQSTSLTEVSSAIAQLDQITQQNAQMVESAVALAQQLEARAESLAGAVQSFRLKQGTADEATALVRSAQALSQSKRGQAFLDAITAKDGGFHDRDMYVFALDRTGAYRAFAGNTAKLGTKVQDIPGVDGQGLLDSIVQQADHGDGWVQYDITNPATGKVQRKMSYVTRVDDLYVGCGVYMSLAA